DKLLWAPGCSLPKRMEDLEEKFLFSTFEVCVALRIRVLANRQRRRSLEENPSFLRVQFYKIVHASRLGGQAPYDVRNPRRGVGQVLGQLFLVIRRQLAVETVYRIAVHMRLAEVTQGLN